MGTGEITYKDWIAELVLKSTRDGSEQHPIVSGGTTNKTSLGWVLDAINDISSGTGANTSYGLPSSPEIGDTAFTRWNGGNGTYKHAITVSGSHKVYCGGKELDSTALARFGEGGGYGLFLYVAADTWELISYIDNDDGNFSGDWSVGSWTKLADGRLLQEGFYSIVQDMLTAASGFYSSVSATTYDLLLPRKTAVDHQIQLTSQSQAAPIVALTSASINDFTVKWFRGSTATTVTCEVIMCAMSEWY